jgi:hypothetical protein
MNTEEKIFSLMAAAEEQQKLTTRLIELQRKEAAEHLGALNRECVKISHAYEKHAEYCSSQLKREADYWFIAKTAIGCFLMILIMLVGAGFYARSLSSEIVESRAALKELEGYSADLSTCSGKPCIRVMKSLGGYGENGDIYIIDPK